MQPVAFFRAQRTGKRGYAEGSDWLTRKCQWVVEGSGAINEWRLTGEPLPVSKRASDQFDRRNDEHLR